MTFRCVEGNVNHDKHQRRAGPATPLRSRLAIVLCLAVFLPLAAAAPAAALSGYASGQSPVNSQYPDAATDGSQGGGGSDGTLDALMASGHHRRASSPKEAARQRQVERRIVRQESAALASATGLTPSQSGSLVLLLGAGLVVSVGCVLRWRRG